MSEFRAVVVVEFNLVEADFPKVVQAITNALAGVDAVKSITGAIRDDADAVMTVFATTDDPA